MVVVNGGAWCGARTSHGHGGLGEKERDLEVKGFKDKNAIQLKK